ncbi:MAG: cyclic nucleotide-binding/CBS domain-containing protein [Acidobacteria bacterium]|nr:cyclic nucleotide-binding/CBS domain-containing protein [Acidobacteriota bacterium]
MDPRSFLRQTPPFDVLSDEDFETAAGAMEIAFHPAGTRLLTAAGKPSEALRLVRKGLVRLEKGGEVTQVLEEGDFFGFSVLTGTVETDVIVEEDLLEYRIPSTVFRALLSDELFARFFTKRLAERLRSASVVNMPLLPADVLAPVGSLLDHRLVTVECGATVVDAARRMRDERVSSVIVLCDPPAIVTDRDLRNRVLAEALGPDTLACRVASSPLRSLPDSTPVFGAMQFMLEHGIHHLPVLRGGQISGIVTSTDLLRHQSHGPLLTFKKVEKMRDPSAAKGYGGDLARMVSTLLGSGLPASHIARLVSHLNDALLKKLVSWAERDLGQPPCPFAFLVFGSEGRLEQTLLTDQDNALVYRDSSADASTYFSAFAESVVKGLVAAGFPPCPGGYMATKWKGPLSEWIERFSGWVQAPQAEAVLAAAIFFDFRKAGGSLDVSSLWDEIGQARKNAPFLSHLSRAAVGFRPPIGAFRRLSLENGGVDVKKGGITPLQGVARVFALDAGLRATSTVERLRGAASAGLISREMADDLIEAFEFLLDLRLRNQFEALTEKRELGNHIKIEALSQAERRHLKEAFLAIRDAQREIVHRYHVTTA